MNRIVKTGVMLGLMLAPPQPILVSAASAEQDAPPLKLTSTLLDRWVEVITEIGTQTAARDTARPQGQEQQSLKEACKKAGFASPTECSCTSLYGTLLFSGYDRTARRFVNPVIAAERRIKDVETSTALSALEKDRRTQRDRRIIAGVQEVLAAGVPAADLDLLNAYFQRVSRNSSVMSGFKVGLTALDTKSLLNQCAELLAARAREARVGASPSTTNSHPATK